LDPAKDVRTAIGSNLRALRTGRPQKLDQQQVADQMRALGYGWARQTVGNVEAGKRALLAEEVFGLMLVLDVTLLDLLDISRFGLKFKGLKGMSRTAIRAWLQGTMRAQLVWNPETRQHTAISYAPEEGDELEALRALGFEIRERSRVQERNTIHLPPELFPAPPGVRAEEETQGGEE
jgi:transcriptional regulator with XRE-family HTH domain